MNWPKLFVYSLILVFIVLGGFFYRWIFTNLILSVILSYILEPFVDWFERKRFPRWLAVLAVYAIIAYVIAWVASRFMPTLIAQGNYVFELLTSDEKLSGEYLINLPFIKDVYSFLQDTDARIPGLNLASTTLETLDKTNSFLATVPMLLMENYQKILSAISVIATIPLLSFFLLKDKHRLRKAAMEFSTNRFFEVCIILLRKIDFSVGNYLRAILFEVIAVGTMSSIALTIVGVPNPVLIGATAGVANIIPYFGPFMGGSLAALSVLISGGSIVTVVYAAIAMYLVQVIDNNVVYPVVVGGTISMHPLIVLLTVIAGGWYGGILWMLISVPLVYISYSLIRVLYISLKEYRII